MDVKKIEQTVIEYVEEMKKAENNQHMEKRENFNENGDEKIGYINGIQIQELVETFPKNEQIRQNEEYMKDSENLQDLQNGQNNINSEKTENLINLPISTFHKKNTNCDEGSEMENGFCQSTEKKILTKILKLKEDKSNEGTVINNPKSSTGTTSINIINPECCDEEVMKNEENGENCETLLELISKKSLLENDKIKKNISSKNFYIIDEDVLVNITMIFDKIILKLIYFYKKNNFDNDKQIEHFHNFFKVLYKLLSNISYHPKDTKYKTIKMCNNQIKRTFLTNDDIFNLVKLLFEILNFNTNCFNSDTEIVNEQNKDSMIKTDKNSEDNSNKIINNGMWKFENEFSDLESILFEFVLSSINIIMGMINKKIHSSNNESEFMSNKKNDTDVKEGCSGDPIKSCISDHNSNKILNNEAKNKLIEKHVNNIMPTNNKLLVIRQKDIEEKNALNDIRKLHNEKFNAYRNNDGYNNDKNKNKKDETKSTLFSNKSENNSLKKGGKKIKRFFKNLFKKD
ncbi:conserved Plasmodium protein, unknown function [Plasmodium berghei]|uniref:PUB domain-containing protein, putative n=3 Tax=Plasmodium berghei TaxID=5821 RepID=A0A509ARF8_PLABA|nr:PUB domain-containing protein, putative [Plasmodium berghei ANKA]CXJ17207.1 conserved Plasmodium protein, unknown function [Plasmodium berghei]SCO62607.1 conserved Plasmodium protein, unknown function [Plasmodium berghei]SCO64166.1 conserved Plasmodium protein, unknown function [Plasmodium berghei]VUC58299.1 PUB domain-containing protein, putative [Plasmodium berghei ANKA]|eukprot:XP_034424062.1 PUB domain-containing protein, putative [Plasmodium berghei ANKA]